VGSVRQYEIEGLLAETQQKGTDLSCTVGPLFAFTQIVENAPNYESALNVVFAAADCF
jgi:hypothetical protein